VSPLLEAFWPGGGFTDEGNIVLIDENGSVVLLDGTTFRRRFSFKRPLVQGGQGVSRVAFTTLAISPDGKRVAAGCISSPLACVWSASDGELVGEPIRELRDNVRALAFSGDGRLLLVAGDDGQTAIREIDGAQAKKLRVVADFERDRQSPVTAAAISPINSEIMAIGRSVLRDDRRSGRFELLRKAGARPVTDPFAGEVRAIAFSGDGGAVAVGGDDPHIRVFVDSKEGPLQEDLTLKTNANPTRVAPHHSERITALAFWPVEKGKKATLLASASMDSSVKIWSLARQELVGTLYSSEDGGEWVAYTPGGRFEGSKGGERLVTWRLDPNWWPGEGDGLIARLDQLGDRYRTYGLTEMLRQDAAPEAPNFEPFTGPRLFVEPARPLGPRQREIGLRIRSTDPNIANLRLYHNGIPISGNVRKVGAEFEATVKLVHQKNEIYAIASRQADDLGLGGSGDSISNRLELVCNEKTPGRLNVLAIGISKYEKQALLFAHEDARAMTEFLKRAKIETNDVAKMILLQNEEVTVDRVRKEFEQLRRSVIGRPEDTIVVFLAGHAALRRDTFCLLLHDAEIPEEPSGENVAMRAPLDLPRSMVRPVDDPTVLPYPTVHFELSAADALSRLVIVDACQAEAIYNRLEERNWARTELNRLHDALSRRAHTSYILATRRGEREPESKELGHGALTYALLRGMGEREGKAPPAVEAIFAQHPSADLDGDGWINTSELERYARLTVPRVAAEFKGKERGPEPAPAGERASVAGDFDQAASFPLIAVPRRP
jgi:hypothetical protein